MNRMVTRFILCCFLTTSFLFAQMPPIGIIDFYGMQKVSEAQVREVLGIKEGDPLPFQSSASESAISALKSAIVARVEAVPGVRRAWVVFDCCHAGKFTLYVGIQEEAGPHFEFHTPPQSDITLPQEIVEDYENLDDAVREAVLKGDAREDSSQGHSLMHNPTARAVQERFIVYAEQRLERIRDVLHHSADAKQRAIAATVIGYAHDKSMVLDDLQGAVRDSNEDVRNDAMRSLALIAMLAQRQPELGIEISPTWFIEMLNSLIFNDRNKAMAILWSLRESRDKEVLQQLREQALPSLVEMARWKKADHAFMAYMLLGRVAGFSEKEIRETWSKGERERVIAQALKSQ